MYGIREVRFGFLPASLASIPCLTQWDNFSSAFVWDENTLTSEEIWPIGQLYQTADADTISRLYNVGRLGVTRRKESLRATAAGCSADLQSPKKDRKWLPKAMHVSSIHGSQRASVEPATKWLSWLPRSSSEVIGTHEIIRDNHEERSDRQLGF